METKNLWRTIVVIAAVVIALLPAAERRLLTAVVCGPDGVEPAPVARIHPADVHRPIAGDPHMAPGVFAIGPEAIEASILLNGHGVIDP